MVLDNRLIGTKCETCKWGRWLALGGCHDDNCCNCKHRIDRNRLFDNYQEDYSQESTRKLSDDCAKSGTKYDF